MADRIVRGACPHDCPDTWAMRVTVADGGAVKVEGDPDHAITDGGLCGTVASYVDRGSAAPARTTVRTRARCT